MTHHRKYSQTQVLMLCNLYSKYLAAKEAQLPARIHATHPRSGLEKASHQRPSQDAKLINLK